MTFDEFLDTEWDRAYRLAYLLGGGIDAEDIVQTALEKTWRAWDRRGGLENPGGYLRSCLATATTDGHRARTRRRRLLERVGRAGVSAVEAETAVADRHTIWPAISSLPPRQRAVIVLRYYEDLSEQQIAEVLGCRPGTVKSTASSALKKLEQLIVRDGKGVDHAVRD